VLLNLVLNAGAAIASAPVASTAGASDDLVPPTSGEPGGTIVVRARRDGASVRLEVEDSGPGISPDVRERIFEPFVTTKEVGTGTGLGLAVCRGIVESAGGTISLDGASSSGARFVVILPVGRPLQSSHSESETTGS
jgi:signal transduction histidine kinase